MSSSSFTNAASSLAASATSLTPSRTSSSADSSSTTAVNKDNSNNNNNPGSFYRNLFYILIGLLVAFALVSFLSLLRARHRRRAITREADRLGLMVPGLPGYIPMRERQALGWMRTTGGERPNIWDVEGKDGMGNKEKTSQGWGGGAKSKDLYLLEDGDELHPVAVIPAHQPKHSEPPIPHSDMPFFPNHLAYRATALLPPPARFDPTNPASLDQLEREQVDVVAMIRMPQQANSKALEEGEEVIREWAGMEVGIVRMDVGPRSRA